MAVPVSTLDRLNRGSRGEIVAVADRAGEGARLRRMGLREGVVVEVITSHDPVMLRVEGSCVAVGRELLRNVTICRCGCDKEDAPSRSQARRAPLRARRA